MRINDVLLVLGAATMTALALGGVAAQAGGRDVESGRQQANEVRAEGGLVLSPPSDDQQPTLTPEEATRNAEDYAAFGGSATKALFAVYTSREIKTIPPTAPDGAQAAHGKRQYTAVPVWVVTYEDACVPILGPVGTPGGCAGYEWNVVVDDRSGQFLQGFSDR